MSGGVFAVDILLTAVVVLYLVHSYGNIRKYPWVCLLTYLTWFICFSIIFILPMDVSSVGPRLRGVVSHVGVLLELCANMVL